MSEGLPAAVTREFERRGELVTVSVRLSRGALEDLEALCRHHYGQMSRSEVVRLAIRLHLAREVVQVIRGHEVEKRRAELAAEEARALGFSREIRDRADMEADIAEALAIVERALELSGRTTEPPSDSATGDGSVSGAGATLPRDD